MNNHKQQRRFNEFVRSLRILRSLSIEEASALIGEKSDQVLAWETSSVLPEENLTAKICEVYKIAKNEFSDVMRYERSHR
jgi:ribosome-binding protein aMBF1 (putative translation factor)